MGLFDSIYLKKYKSLMKQINELNEKNVKGYDTFKEYVLSDEIMMSYFRQLKELEKKIRNYMLIVLKLFKKEFMSN